MSKRYRSGAYLIDLHIGQVSIWNKILQALANAGYTADANSGDFDEQLYRKRLWVKVSNPRPTGRKR